MSRHICISRLPMPGMEMVIGQARITGHEKHKMGCENPPCGVLPTVGLNALVLLLSAP